MAFIRVNLRQLRGGDWDLLRVYLLGEMALCIYVYSSGAVVLSVY